MSLSGIKLFCRGPKHKNGILCCLCTYRQVRERIQVHDLTGEKGTEIRSLACVHMGFCLGLPLFKKLHKWLNPMFLLFSPFLRFNHCHIWLLQNWSSLFYKDKFYTFSYKFSTNYTGNMVDEDLYFIPLHAASKVYKLAHDAPKID